MSKLAVDLGHMYVKNYDGKEFSIVPSVVAPTASLDGTMRNHQDCTIKTENGFWYVGKTAMVQSVNQVSGTGRSFNETPEYDALILYSLGKMSKGFKTRKVSVSLSIPIADWSCRQDITERFVKTHKLEIDGNQLSLEIADVQMCAQGFAPLTEYITPNNSVAGFDSGSRNVNHVLWKNGQMVYDKTASEEQVGLRPVLNIIRQQIQQASGLSKVDIHDLHEMKINGHTKGAKPIDVSKIFADNLKAYTLHLTALIKAVVGDVMSYEHIVLWGGGAGYCARYIRDADFPSLVIIDNPQFAQVKSQFDLME